MAFCRGIQPEILRWQFPVATCHSFLTVIVKIRIFMKVASRKTRPSLNTTYVIFSFSSPFHPPKNLARTISNPAEIRLGCVCAMLWLLYSIFRSALDSCDPLARGRLTFLVARKFVTQVICVRSSELGQKLE